ncbi:MAG: methylenetetrahydrofolate reductase [Candidatus Saganbacteria bacterium]|nr:methylenetetrahydrofolate reductase [Candidatus Saganbacteria bacterium]
MNTLRKAIDNNEFILTAEIFPPRGSDIIPALEKARQLKDTVHAINVTDNQRAVMRMNPIVLCHKLVSEGVDAVYQMSCRDRNSMGLSSDILAAAALGIKNILAITGDYPVKDGKVLAKPVFEVDSVQLIDLIKKISGGKDLHGNGLSGKADLTTGCVVNPNSEQMDLQIMKLRKKIDAGAEFIQTQVVFDTDLFKKFRDKAGRLKAKLLLGIFPLKSLSAAVFMDQKVPGVKVGEKVLKRMKAAKDPVKEGLDIAVETIKELKSLCDGVHFMTMNDAETVKRITEKI